jgi:hypothetical protein
MISTKSVPLTAPFSIRDNIDSDSKIKEESDLQPEKQLSHKITEPYKISGISRPHNLPISSPILAIASVKTTTTSLLSRLFPILTIPTLPPSQFLHLIHSQYSYGVDRNTLNPNFYVSFFRFSSSPILAIGSTNTITTLSSSSSFYFNNSHIATLLNPSPPFSPILLSA